MARETGAEKSNQLRCHHNHRKQKHQIKFFFSTFRQDRKSSNTTNDLQDTKKGNTKTR
jgi:hypothetical protein